MLVIAHRGALHEAQENSWSAFEAAIAGGAERIEMDVRLTRDGIPVIMHDDSLQRMTGQPAKVSDLDFRELQKIRLNNGEEIPVLADVIERLLPRIEVNLETKEGGAKCAGATGDAVEKSKYRERVIFSSFENVHLEYFRDYHPKIRRACLWGTFEFELRSLGNLAPQVFLDRIATNIFHPMASLVTRDMMEQAKRRGWIVYPWDSVRGEEDNDKEGLWTILKTYGVDGLCSNYPRELREWLNEAERDEKRFV